MEYVQTKDERIYKVDTNLLKVANKLFFVAIDRYNAFNRVRPEHAEPDGLPNLFREGRRLGKYFDSLKAIDEIDSYYFKKYWTKIIGIELEQLPSLE